MAARRNNRLKKGDEPILVKVVPEKKSRLAIFWSKFSIAEKVIGTIVVLLTGYVCVTQIYDRYFPKKEKSIAEKSQKDKFIDKYLDTGTLRPSVLVVDSPYTILEAPPIFTVPVKDDKLPLIKGILLKDVDYINFPVITVKLGNFALIIPFQALKLGIKISVPVKGACHSSYISFGIKDNRIYTSVDFYDLYKEEIIGSVAYNHWKLYTPNVFDYFNTDDKLEVIDKHRKIVFSIKYDSALYNIPHAQGLSISGYFMNDYSISVLSAVNEKNKSFDTCLPKTIFHWKEKASEIISTIKTIFP